MFTYLNLNRKGKCIMENNQNEVITLSTAQSEACSKISVELKETHKSALSADDRMSKAVALLLKLLGLKPDYDLLKQVQQVIINGLVNNHGLQLSTSEKLFSQMLKQLKVANDNFEKPAKNTEASARIAESRKFIADKYAHVSLENILKSLQEVSVKTDKDSVELQKELIKAKAWKLEKNESAEKETQKDNIKKFREEIEKMLKVETGLNKNGEPVFSWSVVKLDFVYRCLKNESIVKKALADIK